MKRRTKIAVFVVLLIAVALGVFCWKTQYNQISGGSKYPNMSLTPGKIDPNETKEKVCTPNHTKETRHVTLAMKKEVFTRYGVDYGDHEDFEVDHFIPLVLGGANDVLNLWPEPAYPRPGYHEKDIVEVYLHHRVCKGEISLADAQEAIRKDWYKVYEEYLALHPKKR